MVDSAAKPTPTDRTVAAQVEAWKGLLRSACQSKQISEGRYDAYLDCHRLSSKATVQLVSDPERPGGNVPVALCHL